MSFPPQVEQWRSFFRRLAPDLPTDFLLAWLAKESGGNPCALGIPGVEAGIFQTFHPADDRFGATFAQLRAPCGTGQSLARAMSSDEAELQARAGANFVRGKVADAKRHLAAVGWNLSTSSADFWNAVKQEHALPCVMGDLLPRVRAQLGRAPRSWAEFHQVAIAMPASQTGSCSGFAAAPSVRGLRSRLEDTFANAEEVGRFGGGILGPLLGAPLIVKLALAGVLGWAAYELTRMPIATGRVTIGPSVAVAPTSNPARRRRLAARARRRRRRARRYA
ncbi:MAG TPA: hypothetical protein VFD36_29470 [Kofleriaceae bacterium]|nr:hypothetical protein [Kofleriaceae bacterium]